MWGNQMKVYIRMRCHHYLRLTHIKTRLRQNNRSQSKSSKGTGEEDDFLFGEIMKNEICKLLNYLQKN